MPGATLQTMRFRSTVDRHGNLWRQTNRPRGKLKPDLRHSVRPPNHRFGGLLRAAPVILALIAIGATPSHGRADPYAQPGRLVRLPDGRTINLVCSGRGSPTVLLEAGFGAGAFAWGQVQPIVARTTRVCSYDRAGYGFSDPGPLPRDGASIARDLDNALRRAGERGPFVIVGHSSGGLYGRLFAARRHSETAGLVLVDTSVPFQDRRFAAVFGPGVGGLEGVRRHPAACLQAVENRSQAALEAEGCLPKRPQRARVAAARPGGWRNQVSELDTLFTTTSEQVSRARPVLKDIPTIVLTASPTGVAAGQEDPGAMVWQALHREVAADSLGGQQRLVKSSHLMMSDRPDVVAAAVLELVAACRKAAAQRP
jgi:pimeloyl-ACP methyl ester carboxylesterase